jgi:hypothetical protein
VAGFQAGKDVVSPPEVEFGPRVLGLLLEVRVSVSMEAGVCTKALPYEMNPIPAVRRRSMFSGSWERAPHIA